MIQYEWRAMMVDNNTGLVAWEDFYSTKPIALAAVANRRKETRYNGCTMEVQLVRMVVDGATDEVLSRAVAYLNADGKFDDSAKLVDEFHWEDSYPIPAQFKA